MLPFEPMDPAAQLRDTILDNLRTRTWRAGHRIPTERALGEQFGLSRSTVRRVLHDLKRQRLITQTVGSGTYVADAALESLSVLAPRAASMASGEARGDIAAIADLRWRSRAGTGAPRRRRGRRLPVVHMTGPDK